MCGGGGEQDIFDRDAYAESAAGGVYRPEADVLPGHMCTILGVVCSIPYA